LGGTLVFDLVEFSSAGAPNLNESRGQSLMGPRVLVGVTTRQTDGTISEQRQLVGVVDNVKSDGIGLRLDGGGHFGLPPDLRGSQAGRIPTSFDW
jgi:hypothetical protein